MAHDYRFLAKQRLAKATSLLTSNDDDDLIYACLELRKCVEALAYNLLTGYLHEVPLSAFETWQPDKVMKELLQVDPSADRSATISMQREATATEPAGPWRLLGEDRRLKAPRLAKMFHQLGNSLHVPTIRQMEKAAVVDFTLVRKRAQQIRDELDHVLSAKIWNANFSVSVTVECMECRTPIKRQAAYLEKVKQVRCGGCGQAFKVEPDGQEFYFEPVYFWWTCDGCGDLRELAESKAKPGLDVTCPKCKTAAVIASITSWRVQQIPPGAETRWGRLRLWLKRRCSILKSRSTKRQVHATRERAPGDGSASFPTHTASTEHHRS
jgi:hypothetical protein